MRATVQAARSSAHASLECSRCHMIGGVAGVIPDGLEMGRMATGMLLGHRPSPSAFISDASCRACHERVLRTTVRSGGIAIRHEDLLAVPCVECHAGTGHQLSRRVYATTQMEDCTSCHKVDARNTGACDLCHVEGERGTRDEATAWRVSHGPDWQRTHGMGNLDSCADCHQRDACVKCHGTMIPHPGDWPSTHGVDAVSDDRTCLKCHEKTWCTDCHVVAMPHAEGFLRVHGPAADESGRATCLRCHDGATCDNCHYRSSHPDVPGVATMHGGQ